MSSPALFGDPEENGDAQPPGEKSAKPDAEENPISGTQSLYRKFRPQTFDEHELVGQDAIVRTLRNAVQTNRVAHAYLFSGPRGTGKTTTARLLAKAVNCTNPDLAARPCNACRACVAISEGSAIDVIEIDAASNRGIDDIRELRERVKFAPAQLRTKFYIIDEAHQITGAAANAFLKTLEEPPAHTRFVLATTDPEQILPTIVSRCQRFEFKRIPLEASRRRLAYVAGQEGLTIDDAALDLIAKQAGGSLRDALGLVDQLAAYRRHAAGGVEAPISANDVRDLLGLSREELIVQIVGAVARRDAAEALRLLHQATDDGADPRQINRQIVQFLRAIMHFLADPASSEDADLARVSGFFSLGEAMAEAERFSELDFKVRRSTIPQLPLEIGIVGSVLRDTAISAREEAAPARAAVKPAPPQPAQATDRLIDEQPAASGTVRSLSDRVRAGQPASTSNQQQAAQTQSPGVQPPQPTAPASSGPVTIELIRAQWEQIRANLKARSRRIDALLMSVDPASVQGDLVVLSSAYPFHRNKLNEAEVQLVVEEVISQVVGSQIRISTQLHGDSPAAPSRNSERPATPAGSDMPDRPPANAPPHAALTDDEQRVLDAAKNIFDAEEIEP